MGRRKEAEPSTNRLNHGLTRIDTDRDGGIKRFGVAGGGDLGRKRQNPASIPGLNEPGYTGSRKL